MTAQGRLVDARVEVPNGKGAARLEDKGAYGTRTGDGLELDLHEAAYLVEADRLDVEAPDGQRLTSPELVARGSAAHERFETEYLVYRDYRARGYVIKQGDDELDGWTRGAQPPHQGPSTLICPRGEAEPVTPEALLGLIARSHGLGRGLLLGVVDEESDVTYYESDLAHVTGEVPDEADEVQARVLRDRALLLDDAGLTKAGYGHAVGGQLFCSLAEAHHLATHGAQLTDTDDQPLEADDVLARATRQHAHADEALEAYAWLRGRDLVPKTGFKFGVNYRVYEAPPGEAHAPYLVQALPADAELTYRELARFVRLSHSVRKRPILFCPDGALMIEWTRP